MRTLQFGALIIACMGIMLTIAVGKPGMVLGLVACALAFASLVNREGDPPE
jgi:hypothetical protein